MNALLWCGTLTIGPVPEAQAKGVPRRLRRVGSVGERERAALVPVPLMDAVHFRHGWLRVQEELSRLPQAGHHASPPEAGIRGG